jgi:hypothetical protein
MLEPKPKSKRRPFDWKKKEILSRGRNQAKLVIPKGKGSTRTASPLTFRKRGQSDTIAGLGKAIGGLFKKKKIPGLDNKMFRSGTGNWVGTEEAYADAGLDIPDYGDTWMKSGGSIKKKIKKKKSKVKKRSALRGYGAALRGF